jgi:mannose-6-phosphate isomerase-like protein (cupin superfamily)
VTSTDDGIRPWGTYVVLDEGDDYKVKRISVLPGQRLGYQHGQRARARFVVAGSAP